MTTDSQQIAEDYEQLKELLEFYPNISIIKTEGQPPNSYEIEYNLRGYVKEDDNTIGIGHTHRVQLSLPFGYPHFAPIAKPLTSIFHPDFDPAAVRLADRWQQHPSLPELVLHIGEMICGIVYNLEDPFSQEAAEWYEDHEDQLPLDTLGLAEIETTDTILDSLENDDETTDIILNSLENDDEATDILLDSLENDDETTDILLDSLEDDDETADIILGSLENDDETTDILLDSLEDDDETTDTISNSLKNDDLTALSLERDDSPEPHQLTDSAVIQHIRDLVDENKIFAANKILSELPENISFPDREEIQQRIGKVLRKTDQLFKLAEQLESMSKFDKAMEMAENLQALAIDVPGVDTLKTRIQQAMQQMPPSAATALRKSDKRAAVAAQTFSSPPFPSKLTGTSFGWLDAVPFKPIVAAILLLGAALMAIFLYFKDQGALSRSQANLQQGQILIEQQQFEQAAETLKKAKELLSDLTILYFRKGSQEQSINALLTSSDLQEGLHGRVLYQGEYIPASEAAAQKELAVLTDQAQSLVGQGKITEALGLYRQGLQFATTRNLGKQQAAINEVIQSLELRQTLALAEKCEQEKNWDCASAAYRKALTLSGDMMNLGTTSDITSRMTAATFRHELDQSKKAFTQSQWQKTIKYLEQAQQAIDVNPSVVSERERQDLHRLLTNSRLYYMLSTAREALQQNNWDQAIHEYQNALNLLAREPEIKNNDHDDSLGKIDRTLLMVKITQIQGQMSVKNEKKEDIAANLARYKEIQRLINESAHQNDPAVKNVAQQVADKAEKQQDLLLQIEKIAWLEEHFEGIFRTHYPTFKNYNLSQPKAVFLKKIGGRIAFTVTCLARSQGSASKLELIYQFDPASGKWSLLNN